MKQMIKFEAKRMLRNPGFYIARLLGRGSSGCEGNG